MPLVFVTSTVPHEPYDIRVGGEGEIYTVVTNSTVAQFVPKEHMTAYSNAVAAADSNATVHTRPE